MPIKVYKQVAVIIPKERLMVKKSNWSIKNNIMAVTKNYEVGFQQNNS